MGARKPRPAALVISLFVAAAAAPSVRAEPQTYAELKAELPGTGLSRKRALQAFVDDDRPALSGRLRAAKAMRKGADADGRVNAYLAMARLYGASGAKSKRAGALKKALAATKKAKDKKRRRHIERARVGDKALGKLKKAVAARERSMPSPLPKTLLAHRKDIVAAGKSYAALGDEPRRLFAEYWRLRLDATTLGKGARKTLKRAKGLAKDCGTSRDHASVLRDVHRLRARLLQKAGRLSGAIEASFRADRAVLVPLKKSAFDAAAAPVHARSRETSVLCFKAQTRQLDCAALEEESFGVRSFYDFSRERKLKRFSRPKADAVLVEYDSLLKDCVHTSTELTEFDVAVELEWWVEPSGKVQEYIARPRRLEHGASAECLADAFARIRYPRFRGERQAIELSYDIDAGKGP